MDATFPLCIELEIRKVLRWEDRKAEAPGSKSKVPMSGMRVEIEPSGVQMETEDLAPSEVKTALVARNRMHC